MTTKIKLKEAFEIESKHGAFYTGGNIEWHGDTIYCQTASSVSLLNTNDGTVTKSIGEEQSDDADIIQTFTTDGDKIVSSHKSGLLKLWNGEGQLVKMWKYIHNGPIAKLALSKNRLASGGSDGVVRIWNMDLQTCVLSLRKCQGVINVVEFNEDHVYASGDDYKVNSFDLENKGQQLQCYSGHFSKITSLVFAGEHFVTAGRDKVLSLWKIGEAVALKTIAVYEALETIIGLPQKFRLPDFKADPDCIYVASGGENGVVKVWDVTNSREVYKQSNSLVSKAEDGGLAIVRLMSKGKDLAVVSADHNIFIYHLKSFASLKQFVGFSDEIFDVTYVGPDDSYLAVATNSNDIKLYDASMSCQLLKGHTDMVLALATSKSDPNMMASASKDNRIRLWILKDLTITCVGIGIGHTATVRALSFSNEFLVSGSEDKCLKLWDLEPKDGILNCTKTEFAHQKDINHVSVSPNDRLVATASQDKTVKLWNLETLGLFGTLRGHRRSVWCCKFSPVDQIICTSSADSTIKLWSITNMNCLKTLEGHEISVLNVAFVSHGMQILSTDSEGLIKLFNVKSSECAGTFEQGDAKIWALAISKDEANIVTGGSDSNLIKWKDVTEERLLKRQQEEDELVQQQQQLSNYMHSGQMLKALKLALRLKRPFQVLNIIQTIIKQNEVSGLETTVKSLKSSQKEELMECAVTWNTNSRNCQSAQLVLGILLKQIDSGEFKPLDLRKVIEDLLPYTERHFKRLTQSFQDLHLISYTISCMQPLSNPL